MRALIITVDDIREVSIDGNDISTYYKHLNCTIFTGAGYPDRTHAAYVDDEGLLNISPGQGIHKVAWYPQELVGNILITGFDHRNGETVDATMTVSELSSMVRTAIILGCYM